jgi:sterol desaturase/sphingolipid hydroxylase (fatty acid hydroxylase superfamily)
MHLPSTDPAADSLDRSQAEYSIYGTAKGGGAYNSHLIAEGVFVILTVTGFMNVWLTVWLSFCLGMGLVLDRRTWQRKVSWSALPGQLRLYLQLLGQAAMDLLPYYLFAFLIYLCVAPVVLPLNLTVSSFVLLYGFYLATRSMLLVRYLWVLTFRWENAGRTFATRQANLKSQPLARRHVLWAFFVGNIGLVVRCSAQVLTIAVFERLRQSLGWDLATHPVFAPHYYLIFIGAVILWGATLYWAAQPTLVVYYRTHRTLHSCRPLYDSIHSIHHKGVLPTSLDSGTISPLEFLITEMSIPAATLVPNWWWTGGQVLIALVGHLPSHTTNTWMNSGHHHLLHHRLFNVNFGLIPREDDRFGTRHTEPEFQKPPLPVSAVSFEEPQMTMTSSQPKTMA